MLSSGKRLSNGMHVRMARNRGEGNHFRNQYFIYSLQYFRKAYVGTWSCVVKSRSQVIITLTSYLIDPFLHIYSF